MNSLAIKKLAVALSFGVASVAAQADVTTTTFAGSNPVAGSFSQTWSFTVAAGTEADLTGEVYASFLNLGSFGLWGLDLSTPTSTAPTFFPVEVSFIGTDKYTFTATDLAAGTYDIVISGTTYGPSAYGGSYTLTTSPVPESETYAMMLAGLGLMGFVAARRKSA